MPPKPKEKPQLEAAPEAGKTKAPESPTMFKAAKQVRLEDKFVAPQQEKETQMEQTTKASTEKAGAKTRSQPNNYEDITDVANEEIYDMDESGEEEDQADPKIGNPRDETPEGRVTPGSMNSFASNASIHGNTSQENEKSLIGMKSEAKKSLESARQNIVRMQDKDINNMDQRVLHENIITFLNAQLQVERVSTEAAQSATNEDNEQFWRDELARARANRNNFQQNPGERAVVILIEMLTDDWALRKEIKRAKHWTDWPTERILEAIIDSQKIRQNFNADTKIEVNKFIDKFIAANSMRVIDQTYFAFQLALKAHEDEIRGFNLEEITSRIRRIPETERSMAANIMMWVINNNTTEDQRNVWELISAFKRLASECKIADTKMKNVTFPHMKSTFLELASNQRSTNPAAKRERNGNLKDAAQEKPQRACYYCGGNRHSANMCLLKEHPNANKDFKKSWSESEGGKLQVEAGVARSGTGDTKYLDQKHIVKRDPKGNTTTSETPAELVKQLNNTAQSTANNTARNSSPSSQRAKSDGNPRFKRAKFPDSTIRTGTSQETLSLLDTINNITEISSNLNLDFDATMQKLNEEDKQFDENGRRRKFTNCMLRNGQRWIESYFFPDDGSIGEILSGSYIKRSYFKQINQTLELSIFDQGSEVNLGSAFTGGKDEIVSEYVYLHIDYPSRTTNKIQRACLKIYIVENLRVNLCIGKSDLLSNDFIESKHLWGYGKDVIRAASKDAAILQYMEETYGTFKHDGEAPIVTRALNARSVMRDEMIDLIAHLVDEAENQAIPLVSNPSEHDHVKYFEDIDENDEYEEGTLPTDVDGSEEFKRHMHAMHIRYKDIFSKELLKDPALVEPFILRIDEEKWRQSKKYGGLRSMSFPKQQALSEYLNAGEGILFKSGNADITSPVNMVPKPEAGKWRMTCDFRVLNSCCDKSDFPIPKIQDIFAKIAHQQENAKFFAKIDLTQGFFQVPLAEESQKYTAFKTFRGIHMFLRMPMGTNGASQHFQFVMTEVLKDIPGWGRLIHLYIDDIFVHARTEKELAELLEKIYAALHKHKLCINPKKTIVGKTKLSYLGQTITSTGFVEVSEERKRELFDFPKPKVKKQLKSFLGILNTFRNNIKDCGILQKPLDMMIGAYSKATADRVLIWSKEADDAYHILKERINEMPNLKLKGHNDDYKLVMRTDASDYGCGAHLVQKLRTRIDGKETLGEDETIIFVSKAFDSTQKKWCTSEKECYAVWYACKKLEFLLDGEKFHIEVDHKNLTILDESANAKVQRWKAYLQRYDATWSYIKGATNTIADAMSRIVDIPDENIKDVKDYEDTDILNALMESLDDVHISELTSVEDTLSAISDNGKAIASNKNLSSEEQDFLVKAIRKVHNTLDGHMGIKRTTDLLNKFIDRLHQQGDIPKGINLPRLTLARKIDAVKSFLDRCAICQKAEREGEKIPTTPFTQSSYAPHECIQIDHIGPFPIDAKTKATHVLTIIDTFTRWVELYPVTGTGEFENAEAIMDYSLRYGKPRCILSDHGSGFTGGVFKLFGQVAGIDLQKPEFAGDKQKLGIVERENGEVRRHLTQLTHDLSLKHNWPIALKFVQRILNNAVHSSTGIAPAKLMYGTLIRSPEQHFFSFNNEEAVSRSDYLQEKVDIQRKIINYVQRHLEEKDTINFAKREKNTDGMLKISELVLYRVLNKTKQELVWEGPYMVTGSKGDWYELTSINNDKEPFYVHARQIKRYKQDPDRPDMEVAYCDDLGIIEKIVANHNPSKTMNNKTGVLIGVTYFNFPKDIHWIPLKNIEDKPIFVKYCLDMSITSWLSTTAKTLHSKMIADHFEKQRSGQTPP